MWVPLWGAGTAAPSNPSAHPQKGHPRLPRSAFIDKTPYFCPFFPLSRITARAMLWGRVLTGTPSLAWLRRAERVNCSLGNTDPVPAGWEISNSFLETTATPLGSFPTAPSLTTQGLPQHGMAGQGHLAIPVPADQPVPTPTKPWQELVARSGGTASPVLGDGPTAACGSTAHPALHPSGPSGLARCPSLLFSWLPASVLPRPAQAMLKEIPLGSNVGIQGGRGASPAEPGTAAPQKGSFDPTRATGLA